MAEPTNFDESNIVMDPPPGVSQDECSSINAFTDGHHFITCWKVTAEELEEINRTGRIWLCQLGGMRAHFITGHKPIEHHQLGGDET